VSALSYEERRKARIGVGGPPISEGQFAVRADAVRIDAVRIEAVRIDAVRIDAVRIDAVRIAAVRTAAVRTAAVRTAAVRTTAVWTELAATSFAAAVGVAELECCLTVSFAALLPLIKDFFAMAILFSPGRCLIALRLSI
jgi:hypothetical protein